MITFAAMKDHDASLMCVQIDMRCSVLNTERYGRCDVRRSTRECLTINEAHVNAEQADSDLEGVTSMGDASKLKDGTYKPKVSVKGR